MKILHISDLHLGRRLYHLSFLPQQQIILQQILQCIDQHQVTVVLLVGDIYDKAIPSAEAVTVFDWFLTQLAERNLTVFIISGNHDSPERLQFGGDLLRKNNIHIAGTFHGTLQTVTIADAYGTLRVDMLPYVKPAQIAALAPEKSFSTLTACIDHILQQSPLNPAERNLLLYHGFVHYNGMDQELADTGLQLGGMQLVDNEVFDAYDYVALGHVHKPYWVKKGKIRYSGSILKYSFMEWKQQKSVTILDWKEKGNCEVTIVPLKAEQDVRQIKGPFAELMRCAEPSSDWIRAELTDKELVPYAMEKLRQIYPNILELAYVAQEHMPASTTEAEKVEERSLMDLLTSFYQDLYDYDLKEEPDIYETVQKICQEVEAQ